MNGIEKHTKQKCKDRLHCNVTGVFECEISCYSAGIYDAFELIKMVSCKHGKYT